MKTQVSILVKNESLFSRAQSPLWFINIFKKSSIEVYLDSTDNKQVLQAQNEPYLIDVTPGQHEMMFVDPRAGTKSMMWGITGAFLGGTLAGVDGAVMGYDDWSGSSVKDNVVKFTLNEGDMLKLSVRSTSRGNVKLKILKD